MKKDTKFKPHEIGLMIFGLLLVAFLLLAPIMFTSASRSFMAWDVVQAATVNTLETIGAPWADTVFVVRRNQADSTLFDSTSFDTAKGAGFAAFPYDTLYTWDDTKNYTTKYGWYFPGDGWAVWAEDKLFSVSTVGSGTYLVSWYIIDSLNDVVLPGAQTTTKNWALDAVLATPISDANGIALTSVNSDSIATIVTANGYVFPTAYDSIEFTTDTSDTIYGYPFSPVAPTGDSAATVYGWIFDNASATVRSLQGKKVTFTVANDVYNVCLGRALHSNTVTTSITDAGYFTVELTWSKCLATLGSSTSDTIAYDMKIEGWTNTRKVTVPNTATYEITWQ